MKIPSKIYISITLALVVPTSSWGYTSNVAAGTIVSDETIDTGQQKVYGTTNDITVIKKGQQIVYSGGVINNTVISSSGFSTSLMLLSDAIGNNITLTSGDIMIYGEVNTLTITNGKAQVNGIVNDATLSGGKIVINSNGMGTIDPYTGGKTNNTILTNATMENRFGVDFNTVVNEGATLSTGPLEEGAISTGTSINAIINQDGIQRVNNGGTSIGTTVNVGGNLQLSYFMHNLSSWDNASPARGTAQDSIIYGIFSNYGGLDSNTTIKSGGIFNLYGNTSNNFNGESIGATIEQGGSANLGEDAYATNWNIQGNAWLRGETATIDNSTVTMGGLLQLEAGTANSTTVLDGGTVISNSSTVNINNSTIGSNGLLQLNAGIANTTSILSGGKVQAEANATLENTSVGGTLIAHSGSNILGNLTISTGGQAEIFNDTNINSSIVSISGDLYLNSQNMNNYEFSFDTLDMNGGKIFFAPLNQYLSTYSNDITSTLTVNELSGSGVFYLNTVVSGQQRNFLAVTGSANGQFGIHVADTGANPAKGDSLELVHINSGNADFNLSNRNGLVDIGTYEYELVSNGQGSWYLRQRETITVDPIDPIVPIDPITSPNYKITPSTASVLSLASVTPLIFNAELNQVNRHMSDTRNTTHENGVWGKATFGHKHVNLDQANYKMDLAGTILGVDHTFSTQHGQFTQGGFFSYTDADVKFTRGGSGNVKSYSIGVYSNYLDDNGFFIDAILKANLFRHTSSPTMTSGSKASGRYTNHGIGIQLEVGKYFNFDKTYITPFVGVSAYTSNSSNYNLSNGMHASIGHQKSAITSAGAEIGHTFKVQEVDLKPYARISIEHEFVDNNKVNINYGDHFSNNLSGSRGVIQTGINMSLSNQLSLNLNSQYTNGKNIEDPWAVDINLIYHF